MKVFTVGGWVRDTLLGRTPHDRDYVVTEAEPEEMLALGYEQVGADFPVFLKNGEEYALARIERKSGNGYHGFQVISNQFVTLQEDLLRRDLTINAMAMDDDGNIIDPYGGRDDLECKILRHVSDAFAEDPLRVLRVARFAAKFPDFSIHPSTKRLMRKLVDDGELNHLPAERVWAEFEKAFSESEPVNFIKELYHVRALHVVFPELAKMFDAQAGEVEWFKLGQQLKKVSSARHRFVLLIAPQMYTQEKISEICRRMKVPGEVEQFAINYDMFVRCFNGVLGDQPATALAQMFDFLKVNHSMVAFDECATVMEQLTVEINGGPVVNALRTFISVYNSVTFATLPEVAKQLKGKQIGETLFHFRVKAIEEALKTMK